MTEKTTAYGDFDAQERDFPVSHPNWEPEARIDRLKIAVKAAGGNAEVAKRSGVPLGSLNAYFGGREMKVPAMIALAEACDVTLDWLATGREPMRPGYIAETSFSAAEMPQIRDKRLFMNVDMELLGKAAEDALAIFRSRGGEPDGRQLMQVVTLLHDQMLETPSKK